VCGIVGAVHFDGSWSDPYVLVKMLAQVSHRGPDANGIYTERGVGLGHTRLSIIDLEGGRQPMHNEDRSLWVTFNGEIFNYVELRAELQAAGHRFSTRSDTEVILHAYEEYGPGCVERFNGQWALALWDKKRRRLFASRDRLGVRPLYYTSVGGTFLFASEVKSLFAHPGVDRRIDPCGLNQIFTFWTTLAPRTVFEGIWELPPGHNLTVDEGGIQIERYWQPDYAPPAEPLDEEECVRRLLDLLIDATRLRLRADVPVGAYLSGGLDSTVTAALAVHATDAPLRTFSIAFDDAEFDETRYQEEAAAALGTEHETLRCRGDEIAAAFAEMIWHGEKPVLRTAPAPLLLLSKAVREAGYKVVITGEGADEMLGGYDLFKEAKVRRFWAAAPDSAFRAGLLQRLYPYMPAMQAQPLAYRKAFFHVRPGDVANPLFSHLPRWELTSRLKTFFSDDFRAAVSGHDAYADCLALLPQAFDRWHPFCQAQYLETVILLPGYILSSQGDRMAMAHAVEGRFPFLDHRLAEFAAQIPPRLKMKALDEKYILKRAARNLVPESILRRKKQPYRAPGAKCFLDDVSGRESAAAGSRHELVDEMLSPERIRQDGIFAPDAVGHLVEKVRSGRAIGVKDDMALVGVLSTQLLVDRFVRHFDAHCAGGDHLAAAAIEQFAYVPSGQGPASPAAHLAL